MYLMFVDESGDVGQVGSNGNYFVLSAIVIHETNWLKFLDELIEFRKYLKIRYGVNPKEEIHASEMINRRGPLNQRIAKNDRLDILKKCLDWLNHRDYISIFSACCNKGAQAPDTDIFKLTWDRFLQRFETTLTYNNFPGNFSNNKGIIISDDTNGGKLTKLIRLKRRFNPIPNAAHQGPGYRNLTVNNIIEDPVLRDSGDSYFHQMVDVVAYFARQQYEPNKYIKKKGAANYYGRLHNVLNQHVVKGNTTRNKMIEL